MNLSKYQKFNVERIPRTQINESYYNPRLIVPENEKRLNKILKENGLIEALVWNKQTGNLVSGHQRIKNIDKLEKNQDYALDVCVINVTEEEEVKLNLILNNTSIQGEYDSEKLKELKAEFPNIDFIDNAGFTESDITFFDLHDVHEEEPKEKVQIDNVKAAEIKNKSRQEYKNMVNNTAGICAEPFRNDFILTITFNSNTEKWAFMQGIGKAESEKFIKYDDISEFIREDYRV